MYHAQKESASDSDSARRLNSGPAAFTPRSRPVNFAFFDGSAAALNPVCKQLQQSKAQVKHVSMLTSLCRLLKLDGVSDACRIGARTLLSNQACYRLIAGDALPH
jgi:prepilin-type processing-associated H-X9-DG protein